MAVDDRKMYKALRQARKEYRDPIDRRLEQDWLDERRPIEKLDERRGVGGDHSLTDDQCCQGGEHEIADRSAVVGDQQIRRQNDEVEADEEEYRRRQGAPQLVQYSCANAPRKHQTPTDASRGQFDVRVTVLASHRIPPNTLGLAFSL